MVYEEINLLSPQYQMAQFLQDMYKNEYYETKEVYN